MITTLLFDMDNTLVLFDEALFFKHYLSGLIPRFQDRIAPELFQKQLLASTKKMLNNAGNQNNALFFLEDFAKHVNQPQKPLWEDFIKYYKIEFDAIKKITTPVPDANQLLQSLKPDYTLVLASNPVWPELVQEIRSGWAGVNFACFDHVTHIENTSFCKPHTGYYREICDVLNVTPESCMMIGNDPINDLAAGAIGMKTYLTTDWLVSDNETLELSDAIRHQNTRPPVPADFEGPLLNLKNVLTELKKTAD